MTFDEVIAQAETCLSERHPDEALALYDQLLAQQPAHVAALIGRGRALNNLQRYDEAEAAFRAVLHHAPGRADAYNFLGHVLRAQGRADAAAIAFRAAVDAQPDLALAHYNLGTVLAILGDRVAAVQAFERSVQLGREAPDVFLNLGELYQFGERYSDAIAVFRRGTATFSEHAGLWEAAAALWHSLGEVEHARDAYDRTLALNPGSTVALSGRALLHELWGDIDAGLSMLDNDRDESLLRYAKARLLRRAGQAGHARAILATLPGRGDDLSRDPRLYFTIGEVLDELGQYDAAFAAFEQANELKPAPFDPQAHEREVDALIETFSAQNFQRLARADDGNVRPVFIVGMPRSGTSLVEQILATHPCAHAGGERFEMPEIVRGLHAQGDYPRSLLAMTAVDMNRLRDRYTSSYGQLGADTKAWTDKLPKNFLHLALMALLFPEARVIWCQRDTRDTGLSVYFQNMNFRSDPWTSRLDHIASYARACERLMQHWQSALPLAILPVQYEALIDDPERGIRELLQFLDLPWEPQCLQFHRTKRLVNTASYAQVRRPIYQTSAGRWRNYADHLGPLADIA